MNIADLMYEKCLQTGSNAETKKELLYEISKLAKNSPLLNEFSEEQIFELLLEREKTGSTGFENGIAIPHCRVEGLSEFVLGMITVKDGIDFESYDKQKSRLIFFIIAPEGSQKRHIGILSTISRILTVPAYQEELLAQTSVQNLYESIVRCLPDMLSSDPEDTVMFTIVIQHPEDLNEILQALSTLTENISVIEGRGAWNYLHKLPLYSSFWNVDEQHDTHYVITGTVDKKLGNELIRNIDTVSGGLDKSPGTLVCIQDIFISAGRLG